MNYKVKYNRQLTLKIKNSKLYGDIMKGEDSRASVMSKLGFCSSMLHNGPNLDYFISRIALEHAFSNVFL